MISPLPRRLSMKLKSSPNILKKSLQSEWFFIFQINWFLSIYLYILVAQRMSQRRDDAMFEESFPHVVLAWGFFIFWYFSLLRWKPHKPSLEALASVVSPDRGRFRGGCGECLREILKPHTLPLNQFQFLLHRSIESHFLVQLHQLDQSLDN